MNINTPVIKFTQTWCSHCFEFELVNPLKFNLKILNINSNKFVIIFKNVRKSISNKLHCEFKFEFKNVIGQLDWSILSAKDLANKSKRKSSSFKLPAVRY